MSILGEITALMILLRGVGLHLQNSEVLLTPEVADLAMQLHGNFQLLLYQYFGGYI